MCLSIAHSLRAQTEVNATVTSVSGRSIYIDAGQTQGVVPELLVTFTEAGFEQQYAVVIDVASKSCRAELRLDAPLPRVGDSVRIEVPAAPETKTKNAPEPEKPQDRTPPEHPPWQSPITENDPNAPLLAPARRTPSEQRPTQVKGRIFNQIRYTRDTGGERDSDYTFVRLGARLEITNPFHLGDRILFQGDIDHRGLDAFSANESDTEGRIDRLSYAIGGHEASPFRGEFGRFYSVYVPEIGLIDGAEGALHFDNNWRLGAGAGSYPPPFTDRNFGEDYGVHLFADYRPPRGGPIAGTIAYQQTWHEGSPDQNLFIGRINAKPSETVSIYGLALVNVYTADDEVKGSGVELTQGNFNVRYAPDRWKGAALGYTRTLYPELDRGDFDQLPEDLLRDGQVDRVYISAWARATEDLRFTGRINQWSDQNDDGLGGELGFDWQDVWSDSASIRSSVYTSDGTYTDGVGARLRLGENYDGFDVAVQYDIFQYTQQGMITGDDSGTRHNVRSELGWRNGPWRYNFEFLYTFGDQENSYGIRSFVEYRF